MPAEHIVGVSPSQRAALQEWLKNPNGAHSPTNRVTFEAVCGGGILVRTQSFAFATGTPPRLEYRYRKMGDKIVVQVFLRGKPSGEMVFLKEDFEMFRLDGVPASFIDMDAPQPKPPF